MPNISPPTWRIIPVSKWLATSIYKPFRQFGRGTTLLRELINHGYWPLTGMILHPLTKWNNKHTNITNASHPGRRARFGSCGFLGGYHGTEAPGCVDHGSATEGTGKGKPWGWRLHKELRSMDLPITSWLGMAWVVCVFDKVEYTLEI